MKQPSAAAVGSAAIYAIAVSALGYVLLGLFPMMLFACGFAGGFLLWVYLVRDVRFDEIMGPYFLALGLFVVHKVEERERDFFPALSELTGVPIPEAGSLLAILLYVLAAAWLLIPVLMVRGNAFGTFLAWTFFTSMGVTELAHFLFPLFQAGSYSHFPGMTSALFLVPVGWWGLYRMAIAARAPTE